MRVIPVASGTPLPKGCACILVGTIKSNSVTCCERPTAPCIRWILIINIVIACISATHAFPFANSIALKLAVERCIGVVPSGEKCCSIGGANCGEAGTALMANWDTSLVTDMSALFKYKTSFNQDISGWDVSKVTNMEGMFDSI